MNAQQETLACNSANYVPLTPLTFLKRSALVFPDKIAMIHGDWRLSYAAFYERARRLASALVNSGVCAGDTVAVMAPNVPALLEAHYGVAMAGGVLNAINIRLDAAAVRFILGHGAARVMIADRDYSALVREALEGLGHKPRVIDVVDALAAKGHRDTRPAGDTDYEAFLREGDPEFTWSLPQDEWQSISLNYTSGTTGNPKGVVYHHRGAYLNALGNALAFRLNADSVYLWTLPMFHCNGWCYPWAVTAVGGTHVCLRAVDAARIFALIAEHRVTHLCGAPIVLNTLVHAQQRPERPFSPPVQVATGGAAPPSTVIERMEQMGFRVTHLYGLTESYGPATLCEWQHAWDQLELGERARHMARQGVPMPTQNEVKVLEPGTDREVPADGRTVGEIAMRGNTVMKGYLHNPKATQEAFAGGWFRSGDLAVMHGDNYIEIKDRAKDIIISGGENISTLEIEEVLYRHPAVMEAAVVAKPDEQWGETPCAFVVLKRDAQNVSAADIIEWCRSHLAHFKCPHHVAFRELPKTSTGKIQKFVLREWAKQVDATAATDGT
jgi:3-(methylthio)propionyl---CoA ligase